MRRWQALLRSMSMGRAGVPDGFAGALEGDERVLAVARLIGDADVPSHVVVTTWGIWLPEGRRIGWHLVSKASWSGGALTVVEATEQDAVGEAVLLADLPPRRLPLADPGAAPATMQARVEASIRSRHHRDLPGGGAWFVQRRVAGRDGVLLQVRPDPGTDGDAVRRVAAEVAAQVKAVRSS